MQCIHCSSENTVKNGTKTLKTGQVVQNYLCKACNHQFNDRSGTPMARLRTPVETVSLAFDLRGEGLGIRATARVLKTSPANVITWEQHMSNQIGEWSPLAPENSDITLEGDELYTRVKENLPPQQSQGWTLTFIERASRYWVNAIAGLKDVKLFEQGVSSAWEWAQPSQWIRWFTDGERRYGQQLWSLASIFLPDSATPSEYRHRKVWREGLEVAMKIKGSQGNPRIEWVKHEHPFTAISDESEVHANHNEAHNSVLRRRSSAYHRRQNQYAKVVEGLQRALDVQRLLHNWVRPHWGLGNQQTPAMAMGFIERPITTAEILSSRGFNAVML